MVTSPGAPVLPMYARSITNAVTDTARFGTPLWHCRSLLVMNSGPVWSRSANACSTLDETYMALMAHVKDENTNTAFMKCAAAGNPASTAAMTNRE